MICSSRGMSNKQVELVLSRMNDQSYRSSRDQCMVVLAQCAECSRVFEEEAAAFRDKIIARSDLLCLACDSDASVPAISVLVVRIGYKE